jgi:hypothetical protein
MGAVGEEARQPLGGQRNCIGARDADEVEAVVAGGLRERVFQRAGVAQKSRSA